MATRARGVRSDRAEQELREQEVGRANRELAAYFKGQRTEREARAALKIIKAFIRYRERLDSEGRRPLSGAESRHATKDRKPTKIARSTTARPKLGRRPAGETASSANLRDVIVTERPPEPSAGE